ncbi:hypothetical protein CFAM422_011403 [Trichoderma lentiforme]|uniref:Uncharacterized protein n=1 Tax=Trichoderma lentiforme TaxID=1567552 RepID=A0A9P4X4A4_9HYPO|nr:hypothetical protein CFAM422_011403 [Trichoderma lentiforme]
MRQLQKHSARAAAVESQRTIRRPVGAAARLWTRLEEGIGTVRAGRASPRCKSTDTIRTGRVRLSHSPCGPPTLTPDHPPTTCHFHGIIALCFALAGDCSRNQQPASQCWAAEGIDTADPKFRELQRPCSGRSRLFCSIACR